ncbi:MAG: hypothetical protein LBN34_02210 [Clostridiales Family XIII bacterium]|jgi:hypothetical protein|nr:hypothetical protein [Clostridiales Family XIII bacterium]
MGNNEELTKLEELWSSGVLSNEEYDAAKKRLSTTKATEGENNTGVYNNQMSEPTEENSIVQIPQKTPLYKKWWFWLIIIVVAIICIISVIGGDDGNTTPTSDDSSTETESDATVDAEAEEKAKVQAEADAKAQAEADAKAQEEAEAKAQATAEAKINSAPIEYRDLFKGGEALAGNYYRLEGEIIQDAGDGTYRVNITKTGTYSTFYQDTILIFVTGDTPEKLIEDDVINFVGISAGNYRYETTMGGTNEVPLLLVDGLDVQVVGTTR